jgi:hypothetical protein
MKSANLGDSMNSREMMDLQSFLPTEPLSGQYEPSEQHDLSSPSFVTPHK